MEFENRIKGYVTESLIESILTDAGYKVLRVGLEKRVLDSALLKVEADSYVPVPDAIRLMPDFMILENNNKVLGMLEVKYRGDWKSSRASLSSRIKQQLELYPDTKFVICCGHLDKGKGDVRARDHIKLIYATVIDGCVHHIVNRVTLQSIPLAECDWDSLHSITTHFDKLFATEADQTLIAAANIVQNMEKIFSDRKKVPA